MERAERRQPVGQSRRTCCITLDCHRGLPPVHCMHGEACQSGSWLLRDYPWIFSTSLSQLRLPLMTVMWSGSISDCVCNITFIFLFTVCVFIAALGTENVLSSWWNALIRIQLYRYKKFGSFSGRQQYVGFCVRAISIHPAFWLRLRIWSLELRNFISQAGRVKKAQIYGLTLELAAWCCFCWCAGARKHRRKIRWTFTFALFPSSWRQPKRKSGLKTHYNLLAAQHKAHARPTLCSYASAAPVV